MPTVDQAVCSTDLPRRPVSQLRTNQHQRTRRGDRVMATEPLLDQLQELCGYVREALVGHDPKPKGHPVSFYVRHRFNTSKSSVDGSSATLLLRDRLQTLARELINTEPQSLFSTMGKRLEDDFKITRRGNLYPGSLFV